MSKEQDIKGASGGITRRRFVYSAAAGGLVAGAAMPLRPARAAGKVALRYVSVGSKSSPWAHFYRMLAGEVKKASDGDLVVEWAGGPELAKPFQAPEAVGKGVFDACFSTFSYYTNAVPAGIGIQAMMWSLPAVHESGAYAFLDELHRKGLGVSLLNVPMNGVGYIVMLNKPVSKLADFKGSKVRSLPIYDALFKSLGMATTTISPTEVYTALERGVVDGCGWPEIAIAHWNYHKIAKYLVHPPFYHCMAGHLINERKLNSLPKDLRGALTKAARSADELGRKFCQGLRDKELAKMKSEGLVISELKGDEAKKYLTIGLDRLWEKVVKDDPKDGPRLRALVEKAASMSK